MGKAEIPFTNGKETAPPAIQAENVMLLCKYTVFAAEVYADEEI